MSAVEVEILGSGSFAGSRSEIVDYSSTESATSLDLNDLSGGVGRIDFTVIEDPSRDGTILLPGQPFLLSDPHAGSLKGAVDGITVENEAGVSISGSPLLLPLVAERGAAAFSGTLAGALQYYMALCGVLDGIQIDPDFFMVQVNLPSWSGDVWTSIKKLAAIHQFEIAAVADAIIIRKPRLRTLEVGKYESLRLLSGEAEAAREVEVHYYNTDWKNDVQVYPDPEVSIIDRSTISVRASETTQTNVPVNMWLSSIDEPVQVLSLPWDNTTVTSVYSVVDKDGKPVSPGDWRNGGGLLSAAIGPDGRSIDITVRGMSANSRSPYRIASSSEDQEYQYPALYLAATGVAFDEKIMRTGTGADEQYLPVDSVVVIDEPMVSTPEQAATVMMNAALALAGESQAIEARATAVNRRGDTGEIAYPTFGQFDEAWPTETFGQFDTWLDDMTFGEFDTYQANLVRLNFDSQAFGGIGGARVPYRYAMYRATDGTVAPGSFGWTAREDTLFSDFDEAMASWEPTFGEFDAFWPTETFGEVGRSVLATP